MLFTSLCFFVFFVVLIILYYSALKRFQWQLLLLASAVFYAFSGWWNLFYLTAVIITTYFTGRKITAIKKTDAAKSVKKAKSRLWLIACLVFNFGVLAVTKYAGLMLSKGYEGFFGFLVPMGISFYTFQAMSYIIDCYRGKEAENSLAKLAVFTSFFPQLIQGPISRYEDLKQTLFSRHNFNGADFAEAGQRVLLGFFKKLVIADRLLPAVKELTSDVGIYGGLNALLAVSIYAVTLYADFTGGIDITIGAAAMLGVRVKENFNMPFYSKSIAEYWRRWHITMGTWFKDYLFYPISVSKPLLNLMKRAKKTFGENFGRRVPVYISTILLWFMTGLWHGATANFITWGLVNGVVIIISTELTPFYKAFHSRFGFKGKVVWNAFEILRTFWLMCFIRAFDIYPTVKDTLAAITSVFGRTVQPVGFALTASGLDYKDYIIAGAGVLLLILAGYINRRLEGRKFGAAARYAMCLGLFLAVAIFGAYGTGYDASQFIYNRF